MAIDYIGILACGVLSMVLGFVWYGPLFGKKWMQVIGADKIDMERRAEMMKGVWKLYIVSFILALAQACTLSFFIQLVPEVSAMTLAWKIWLGFNIPIVAGGAMWNNDSARVSWARFLIQAPYYLVLMLIFALVLGR